MSLTSGTGFILRLDPISEKDLAVSMLLRGSGVVRGVVRGARGNARKASALQLLTEVSVTVYRKEGAERARFDSLEIVQSAFHLAARADTAMLLPYLAEHLLTFVLDSDPGEEIYRLTRHVLGALSEGSGADLSARYFEVWLLRFAGLLPDPDGIPPAARELVAAAQRLPLPKLPVFSPGALRGTEEFCREIRREFLGHELKSYRFLGLT